MVNKNNETGWLLNISQAPETEAIRRVLELAADRFSLAGGLLLLALITMSIVSIVGRKLFAAPIQGDVELVQMAVAVAAAAFLPYCEIYDHNIKVDAFTEWLPAPERGALDTLAHLTLTLVALFLTWRTALQAIDTRAAGEVSALLSVPMWLPVASLVPSLALLTLCCAFRATQAMSAARRPGR